MPIAFAFLFFARDTLPPDSLPLPTLTVTAAFPAQNGASATLTAPALRRLGAGSLAEAANTVPGVRMEERSPGSFRFSMRGSLLRSPFGVRNVKVYFDGAPLTDPGGGTYLQLIDVQTIDRIELLKGPAGSLYGAGTGGAVLLYSPQPASERRTVQAGLAAGAYGRIQGFVALQTPARPKTGVQHRLSAGHIHADGYRQQTRLRRDGLYWSAAKTLGRHALAASLFLTDLFYQTPGGLTRAEMEADPRQARPPTATLPGAREQGAAVRNRTGQLALTWQTRLGKNWSSQTIAFGRATGFVNPTIRNYETREEINGGARTAVRWEFRRPSWDSQLTLGAETAAGRTHIETSFNHNGKPRALQTDDHLAIAQGFAFLQEKITWRDRWVATAGASLNGSRYTFERRAPTPETTQQGLQPVISPRLLLQHHLPRRGQFYAVLSHGFSPPTIEELRPSTGQFNRSLQPEAGWNLEAGAQLQTPDETFRVDLTVFQFNLNRAIVLRRAADGAEYFENAGGTRQRGLEASLRSRVSPTLSLGLHHTWNHFRFGEYRRADQDFSGNRLTGVPQHVLVATLDWQPAGGLFAHLVATRTDRLPLDDANTEFAGAYTLLSARAGWKSQHVEIFAGGDNLLNTRYSAGHDLNAIGGRYYNPAAGRTGYAGMRVEF